MGVNKYLDAVLALDHHVIDLFFLRCDDEMLSLAQS
jgi:hypothetical protein